MLSRKNIVDEMERTFLRKGWRVTNIRFIASSKGNGLLNKPIQKYEVEHDGGRNFIVVKILEGEPRILFRELYQNYGHASASQLEEFDSFCYYLSITDMPERERTFYQYHNAELKGFIPEIYGIARLNVGYLLFMEDLSYCGYMDKIKTPEIWGKKEITLAVKTLAFFHSMDICGKKKPLYLGTPQNEHGKIAEFLESLEKNMIMYSGMRRIPELDDAAFQFISNLSKYEECMNQYGRRIIHGDFHIRNICIDEANWRLKVYDWELMDYKNPIADLVDLFISLSPHALSNENLDCWLEIYRKELVRCQTGGKNKEEIKEQLYYNVLKYAASRINLYLLFYAKWKDSYMERMYRNLFILLEYCEQK